ncbi:hypothetical protein Bca52824_060060 [Brassica carinata]|uniref:Uncharacterized protein n=1 Tax=Brassica carinata TaxID=52824 RepID=A0A8X7QVM2_BRACI|nr:hypothetical protein Bca52824_060060 [Brassica carinata]
MTALRPRGRAGLLEKSVSEEVSLAVSCNLNLRKCHYDGFNTPINLSELVYDKKVSYFISYGLITVDPVGQGGLKEEIRDGLETEEFTTLEALFEEAEEVEEGLKETPPSSPRKRRRTSPDHRSSKRARKGGEKR